VGFDGLFPPGNGSADKFAEERLLMVETQIRKRGIANERVLQVMATVPRHEFVPPQWIAQAYADEPLPIGHGQTISQPYIVAAMAAALGLTGSENVLEIGTGCGYQAAVVSMLAREVHTVELLPDLAQSAAERLQRLGYANVHCSHPATARWVGRSRVPTMRFSLRPPHPRFRNRFCRQLAEGGRLIAPVGEEDKQELHLVTKREGRLLVKQGGPCRFVPLMGQHGWQK